jgi:hypothetical protein
MEGGSVKSKIKGNEAVMKKAVFTRLWDGGIGNDF